MTIDAILDDFTGLIRGRAMSMKTERDEKGLRIAAATGLLFRGLELLDAARLSPTGAGELLVRVAVEVSLRGRFLLLCKDGSDEFARMLGDHQKRGEQQVGNLKLEDPTAFADTEFVGVAPWVLEVVKPSPKKLRNPYELATALDELSGLEPKNPRSGIYAYRRYYQWLSNAAMHGGLNTITRFVGGAGSGVVEPEPEPLSSPGRRYDVPISLQLLELARAVWNAHGLTAEELEATGVRWEKPEDADAGDSEAGPAGIELLQVGMSGEAPGVLADVTSMIGDLRFVAALCDRLGSMPQQGEEGFDPLATRAYWTAAVITYSRSHARGKGYLRSQATRTTIPDELIAALDNEERAVHDDVLLERDKHIAHRINDLEQIIVVLLLNPPPLERAVAGVHTLTAHLVAREPEVVVTLRRVATKLADRLEAEAKAMQEGLIASGSERLDQLYRDASAASD